MVVVSRRCWSNRLTPCVGFSVVIFQFSKYLVDCGVAQVCTLHKGFNILHSVVPNILVTS